MKLTDYIQHLQYLHSKCGDVDVMNKTAYQRKDRSYKNEYTDVKLAHYESTKQGLVVVIYEDFIPYVK